MKRRVTVGATAVLVLVLAGAAQAEPGQSAAGAPAGAAATDFTAEASAVVGKYCVTCHNQRLKTADVMFDAEGITDIGQHAEVWEKVVRKVRSGSMPPLGRPRPEPAALTQWVAGLEKALDSAAAARPNPGRVAAMHRLNQTEYPNVIRDLLHLDVDGGALLPVDDAGYGFDNNADVLSISPPLLQRYMLAAAKVSRLAMGAPISRPTAVVYMNSPLLWQEDRVSPDLPFGSRGGIAVRHTFPVAGEYEFNIRIPRRADPSQFLKELQGTEPIEVRIDHERVKLIEPKSDGGEAPEGAADYQQEEKTESVFRFRLPVKAGPRLVAISFVADMGHRLAIDARPLRPSLSSFFFQTYPRNPEISGVQIVGPFDPRGAEDTPSRRRVLVCQPSTAVDEEPCAREILATLAHRAYRGTARDADVVTLMAAYKTGRSEGDFETGIQWALEALLVQPKFLFRVVRDPEDVQPGVPYRLSDLELASRLSFFLWSSIPDDELLAVAKRGTLSNPVVLEQQVRRMLADSRSAVLAKDFAGQWLWLRKLRHLQPNPDLFPYFEENLRQALRQETELFIESQVREDRSISELLTADYTFVNERLAQHYRIPHVYGDHFRRITAPDERRLGLLGHGSILAVTSYANRTSPVIRGKWLLENFLGTPPPPPPPNVEGLKENREGEPPTTVRERLEAHRRNPACATCHKLMDPLGFALENFDALGRWRAEDAESKERIDSSGTLVDGTEFDGPAEFRNVLLERRVEFVDTVIERLLTYALGRGTEYYDRPAIRTIVREAGPNDYRWSSIILGIVKSDPFQMRAAADVAPLQAENTASPARR